MIDIKSMTIPELEELLTGMGEKKFRAAQLFQWLHQKQVTTFDEMKNLPGSLREKLSQEAHLPAGRHHQVSLPAGRRQPSGERADAL